jgi:hypothetical protein
MTVVPRQSKNRKPDAPICSVGCVSNLLVRASEPKIPRARKLKKNATVPISI